LLAAVNLDEKNPMYHVMLAELYHEHGLHRRADAELERALHLDPGCAAALRLREQLRGGK
jgi:Tfp pilus assembly protein PilF